MPFEAEILEEQNMVITRPIGAITNEELLTYYRGRLDRGTLHPGLRELVDARGIEEFGVDPEGQRRLATLLKENAAELEGVRWAFVARRPLAFGMFRMFEAQKSDLPFETGVFESLDAALDWLDVPRGVAGDAA